MLCCFNSDGDFYYLSIDTRRDRLFYVCGNIMVTTMNRLALCSSAQYFIRVISTESNGLEQDVNLVPCLK